MKKLVSLSLVVALCMSLYIPAHATNSETTNLNNGFRPYSDAVTSPAEQDRAEREFFAKHRFITNNFESNVLRGPDIGNGSVDIVTTGLYSGGGIYWDSKQEAKSALSTIANIGMSIWGGTVGTVISVVSEVFSFYGITGQADQSKPGEVKVGHAIMYRNKYGKFNYNSNWYRAVTIQQRYFYKYMHATAVVNGTIHQLTADYTADRGYSPYFTETKPNYNDNAYISELVIARYNEKVKFGYFGPYNDTWVDNIY